MNADLQVEAFKHDLLPKNEKIKVACDRAHETTTVTVSTLNYEHTRQ